MGKFWTSKARFSTKRLVFISKVWGAATSAIESLLWSKRDMKQMEAVLWKLGKKLLPRWGNKIEKYEDGNETFTAIKADEVRRKLKLPTLSIERDVRQLKWTQQMLRDPEHHVHELAALFGTSRFDENDTLEQGQLHEQANPWGNMFQSAVWRILGHN